VCGASACPRAHADVQGVESYEEEGSNKVPDGLQVPAMRQEYASSILSIQIGSLALSLSLTPLPFGAYADRDWASIRDLIGSSSSSILLLV